jgi:anaerobic selenocysteine-containing dehydrogenase
VQCLIGICRSQRDPHTLSSRLITLGGNAADGDQNIGFRVVCGGAPAGDRVGNDREAGRLADLAFKVTVYVHNLAGLEIPCLHTGERALILPCLGRSEEDIQATGKQFLTVEDSMGIINPSHGFLPPASPHLMSDVASLANLAHATLGSRTSTNWLGFAADYNLIRDAISHVIPGFENFNTRLASEKFFYLPNAAKQRIFKTKSGKAKMSVCPIPKHDLKPDEFLLTTIRSHDQFNSTIYGLNDRYRGVFDGRRVLFLNPLDCVQRFDCVVA